MKRWWMAGLMLGLLVGVVSGQEEIHPELQAEIDEIEGLTLEIRGLELKEDVTLNFPTREDLSQYLQGVFDEELTDEDLAKDTFFYVAFDLMSPDVDLRQVYVDLYLDQIAGFYDSDTKEMNVILMSGAAPSTFLPILEKITYSHEFVHALQDQYFDLDAIIEEIDAMEGDDRILAALALIEGDATAAMTVYATQEVEKNPLLSLIQIAVGGRQAGGFSVPAGTPAILETELLFPYLRGQFFVDTLRQQGGWELVNEVYDNLPISTEQIYHPDRYLAGDMPLEVQLPDFAHWLGDDGWVEVLDGTMGEFYLRQYLDTQLSRDIIDIAATGWGGDHYKVYQQEATGDLLWVLRMRFDTIEDTNEFEAAYGSFGDARFGAVREDGRCWENTTEALCAMRHFDDTTMLMVSAPTRQLAEGILFIDD